MPTNDLSPAAEAFLSGLAHWLPKDVLEEARGRLAGLLAEERAEKPPTFRFRALTAVAGETWVPLAWWIDLQPVLAEVAKVAAAAEREACRAEAAPRWTACAEGLPAEGVPVLACHERRQAVATWDGWHWRSGGTRCSRAWFSHWRPLPPGPEEGEEERC